jgi:cation transport ATPase
MLLMLHLMVRAGLALDITTTDGKTYKDCTITQVEVDSLHISYAEGVAHIPYEKLPDALQKQYFDPEKVAAYRQKMEEARRAAAARAEEERRQQAIAAAKVEEQQRAEFAAQWRAEEAQKAAARSAEEQRQTAAQKKKAFGVGLIAIVVILSLFLYFLPTIVGRHKSNAVAIFVLNLLLGWTLLGWVIALVWACTEDSALDQLARARMNMPPPPPAPPYPPAPSPSGPAIEDRGGRYLE